MIELKGATAPFFYWEEIVLLHQKLAVSLGALGLIPFLLGPILMVMGINAPASLLLKTYSVAIFCFLCGSWWGIVLVRHNVSSIQKVKLLALSNLFVVTAVGVAVLFDDNILFLTLAVGYLSQLGVEGLMNPLSRQPLYYRRMRITLSCTAAACLVIAAVLTS